MGNGSNAMTFGKVSVSVNNRGGGGAVFIYANKFTRIKPLLRTKENNSEFYKLKWKRERKSKLLTITLH